VGYIHEAQKESLGVVCGVKKDYEKENENED